MKTRIATAISVVGVLGAGSAAALVNTQILDGGAAESSASAAVLPTASTVDVTIPEVPAEVPLVVPVTVPATTPSTSSTIPESTLPAEPAPTGYLTAFNVGQAGTVTVDVIDGVLVLVEAEPKSGWAISDTSEDTDDNEVEVEFSSGSVRVEFEATFVDGQIVPKVTSRRVGGGGSPAPAPPSGTTPAPAPAPVTTIDDDRDDDDHDDDGHDDDGHDDDGYDDDGYDDDRDEEDEPDDRDERDEEDEEDEEDEPEDRDDD